MLKSGHYRNSFDRFCDDLCEQILQYLSFEDKIRFECVSKQWMATIYQTQHVFESHSAQFKTFNKLNSLPHKKVYSYSQHQIKSIVGNDELISNFERILKKCRKIHLIIIENKALFMSFDTLLRVIIDTCDDLKAITVYNIIDADISRNTLIDFGVKFGRSLETMNLSFHQLIVLCPNIGSISDLNIRDIITSDISLPKLSEVRNIFGCDDSSKMETFVTKFRHSLRVFHAQYKGNNCNQFLALLSQLTNLEKLSLDMRYYVNISEFAIGLTSVAVNCQQLKHLRLDLRNQSNYLELLNAIDCFHILKSLRLSLRYITESVALIKNCKQLTRLDIGDVIHDTFFKHIDEYLPKLSFVKITSISSDYKITNQTLNYLANLNNLKVIEVNTYSKDKLQIKDTAICNVIEKCTLFQSFRFDYCPQITEQTIRVMIEIAKSRPHINFNHNLGICGLQYYNIISSAINSLGLSLNITISYKQFTDL